MTNLQAQAIQSLRVALADLELAFADTEAAPVAIVLTRDRSSGRVHRRARVADIPGLLSLEGCNLDDAGAFDVIPDLSRVADEQDLCERCFGPLEPAQDTD